MRLAFFLTTLASLSFVPVAFGNILHCYESKSLVTSFKGRRKEDRNRVSCRGKVHCIYRTALDKAEQRRLLLVCTYIGFQDRDKKIVRSN